MDRARTANPREWSIQALAGIAGTTSRTLRHYGAEGLLAPSRTGSNGQRFYDEAALVRLQRILLLRGLGLGIPAIRDLLAGATDDASALRKHLNWLRAEQERLARQVASVERTIADLEEEKELMAERMFEGFDHTQYRDEVEQRWGAEAYASSDAWWRGMSTSERAEWQARTAALGADWSTAAARRLEPASEEAQALARRQYEWLSVIPSTPRTGEGPSKEYVLGLAEMYVADERFAANYGGVESAAFVRDAMTIFAEESL